jgi:hypothetical protein
MVCAVLGLYTLSGVGTGVWRYRLGLYTLSGVGTGVWRYRLALLIGHLKTETESSLRNVVFLNKNRTIDMSRKSL